MAEIKWIKLSVNMFDDEKIKLIKTMPEGNNIVMFWIQLLCLAGRINDGGLIYFGQNLAYSDEMLATILDIPLNVVRSGLKTLDQFGMIDVSDNGMIDIANWEKHQNVDGMERVKDGNAERQRVSYYRKKLKQMGINPFQDGIPTDSEELKEYVKTLEDKNLTLGLTLAHGPEEDKEEEEDKNKSKNKTTTTDSQSQLSEVLHFFQDNFGVLSSYIQNDLSQWCNDLSPELAIKAMSLAAENGKQYSYAKGIMQNWLKNNIKTLEDVEAEQRQFQKNKVPFSRKQKKDEIKPYWAKETADTEQVSQQTVDDSGEDILSEFRSLVDEFKEESDDTKI